MLILIPGLICDERIFAPQTAAFAQTKAVAGHGSCTSLTEIAQKVLADAPAQFDLLGHSMGGRIALEIYRLAPSRTRRLALLSTGVHPVSEGEPEKRATLQAIGHEQGFAALVDAWLPPMIAPQNRDDESIVGPLRAMCLDQGQAAFDAQVQALLTRDDAANLLPGIACPTLVMTGEHDVWSPPSQHEAIAAAIPNATLSIIADAGHMLTVEQPTAVNDAIATWLARPVS